tara:strand:+ start:385 stop:1359 length:975 start_codon:yes stop_codon:yes gene_type:complete
MKKILIIGSNSFSGSHMCDYFLKKGYFVLGISRSSINNLYLPFNSKHKNFKFFKLDLNKHVKKIINIIKKNKPYYVLNYAAQGMVNESWLTPLDWYQTNVISNIKLIENIKKFKFIKKFLQFSTPEVYGDTKKTIYEEEPFNPTTPYAISRSACDYHLLKISKFFNFPVVITRTSNVYGPYQRLYRIVPKTMMMIKKNKKILVHGKGLSSRSFIHISDVCEAVYKILLKGKIGQCYHISTNSYITIKKLVEKINKLMNIENMYSFSKDRIGKDHRYHLSSKKLKKKLRWSSKIKIDKGLEDTLNWIESNYKFLRNEKLIYEHKK